MTYEMYRYIFLGAAIGCGVMTAVSVILFFVLKIPKVIGDLSGRNAKKAIENIRRQNEASGDKSYQSSAVNMERGKLTDKISHSGRVLSRVDSPFGTGIITEKISTQQLPVEQMAGETDVLSPTNETTVLNSEMGQTVQLDRTDVPVESVERVENVFGIEYEITFIHTNEVIT